MFKTLDGRVFSDEQMWEFYQASNGQPSTAEKMFGISRGSLRNWFPAIAKLKEEQTNDFVADVLPELELPVEDIIARKKIKYDQIMRRKNAEKLVGVKINIDGPIMVMHMGDPHIDDDKCNITLIEEHKNLAKTEGVYIGCVGDLQNNWIGRLARLHAHQSTTAAEGWKLVEWFLTSSSWLYMVNGNHDVWVGDGNPVDWIVKQSKVGHYANHGARIELRLPSGSKVVINARHDHKGHSMWNPSHGVMKAAQTGWRDHVVVSGHKHISGHAYLKDPMTGRITHGIQVASYKTSDDYAEELGFTDQNMFCCPATIIDPRYPEDDPNFITFIPDPKRGVQVLKMLRAEWKKGLKP